MVTTKEKVSEVKSSQPYFGRAMKRVEDPRLVEGVASYVDDLKFPGMLHAEFVRSPHANANINSIKTDAAKNLPAVVGMAERISVATAGRLTSAFYGQLREHGRPDVALAEARAGILGRQDVRVPVLVVCGAEDAGTPPAQNRGLAALVPGARYQEIAGARHFPNVEHPDLFNRIMLDWLDEQHGRA